MLSKPQYVLLKVFVDCHFVFQVQKNGVCEVTTKDEQRKLQEPFQTYRFFLSYMSRESLSTIL